MKRGKDSWKDKTMIQETANENPAGVRTCRICKRFDQPKKNNTQASLI